MPLSKVEFQQLAFDLAKKLDISNTFNQETEKAGGSFYYGFMKRHPDLSLRKPNNTNVDRLDGFNKDSVEVSIFHQTDFFIGTVPVPAVSNFQC